jgi:hypothetical protein
MAVSGTLLTLSVVGTMFGSLIAIAVESDNPNGARGGYITAGLATLAASAVSFGFTVSRASVGFAKLRDHREYLRSQRRVAGLEQ